MALNLLWGWNEARLVEELVKAQDRLMSGGATISNSAGDVARQVMIQNNSKELIKLIQEELYLFDPVKYPEFENAGHNQTVGNFA